MLCVAVDKPADPLPCSDLTDETVPVRSGEPIRSKDLLQERSCVMIEHEGMLYALRTTRAGKLILTK